MPQHPESICLCNGLPESAISSEKLINAHVCDDRETECGDGVRRRHFFHFAGALALHGVEAWSLVVNGNLGHLCKLDAVISFDDVVYRQFAFLVFVGYCS